MNSEIVPHISILLDPKKDHEKYAELLLKSIIKNGNCNNFICTIVIPKETKLNNKYLLEKCNYLAYKTSDGLPWKNSPRFSPTPQSNLFVGIDFDVIALKDINDLFANCLNDSCFSAVQAVDPPFENSFETWSKLYRLAGMDLPNSLFVYRAYKEKIWTDCDFKNLFSPFYPNCGVVLLPSNLLCELKRSLGEASKITEEVCGDNCYFAQICLALALDMSKTPKKILETKYNHLESFDGKPDSKTVFFHFNKSRDNFYEQFHLGKI